MTPLQLRLLRSVKNSLEACNRIFYFRDPDDLDLHNITTVMVQLSQASQDAAKLAGLLENASLERLTKGNEDGTRK